mmetsp:Transcript_52875/g.141278  ORF Transcript_52875/g.141278 Transcript_52875/m.141278 type:complete len:498 (-) Transcript_52875:144-1637(-)
MGCCQKSAEMVSPSVLTHFEEEKAAKLFHKYHSPKELLSALQSGSTSLLRGEWLVAWAGTDLPLPRRQELPPEASWKPANLGYNNHGGVIFDRVSKEKVAVIAVSHHWQNPTHPDPECAHLRCLARGLHAFHQNGTWGASQSAVFFDWCSLFQEPRTADEELTFQEGLCNTSLWFSNKQTKVWCIAAAPMQQRTLWNRGWPKFEKALAQLIHSHDDVLEIGDKIVDSWSDLRRRSLMKWNPPERPTDFADRLEAKGEDGEYQVSFTSGSTDRPFVSERYRDTFLEILDTVDALDFGHLDWQDSQVSTLAETLPQCGRLTVLKLDRNEIGDAGARALALALPSCVSLTELHMEKNLIMCVGARALAEALPLVTNLTRVFLHNNTIGDGGAQALARALPQCRCLTRLDLQNNSIRSCGARSLAVGLPKCALERLDLSWNDVGDGGAEALAHVVRECSLTYLNLRNNAIHEDDKRMLRQVWKTAGKPSDDFSLDSPGVFV